MAKVRMLDLKKIIVANQDYESIYLIHVVQSRIDLKNQLPSPHVNMSH